MPALTKEELSFITLLGSEVSSLENSIYSDLPKIAEARKEFDSLPNRDKILKQREQETIVYKVAPQQEAPI
jgi:hypothetical protein